MSANKAHIEPKSKVVFLVTKSVVKVLVNFEFKYTVFVGDHRSDSSDSILLPNFEPFHQFFTFDNDVIVEWEEDFGCGLLGQIKSPIHGVVGGAIEVDRYLPIFPVLEYP